MQDDPLMYVLSMCRDANTKPWRYIHNVLHHGAHAVQDDIMIVKDRIRDSISSKCQTYSMINPNMTIHGLQCTCTCIY